MKNSKYIYLKLFFLFNSLIFYSPIALLIRTSRGISVSEFFILQGVLSFGIFIFEVPCGMFTDKIGYKKTIILSVLLMFISRVILLYSNSFKIFVFEALLESIAFAFSSGTVSAYLYNLIEDRHYAKITSVLQNYGTIGFLISIGGFYIINRYFKIKGLILFTILANFIALLFIFMIEDVNYVLVENKKTKNRPKLNFKLFLIICIESLISISNILINFFYISIVLSIGFDENFITYIILGYSLVELTIPKLIDWLGEEKLDRKIMLILFFIALIFISLTITNEFVIISMLILPSIISLLDIYLEKYSNIYIDEIKLEENRATTLSFMSMGSNLVEIIFLFISAKIVDINFKNIYIVISIIFLITALIFKKYKMKIKKI